MGALQTPLRQIPLLTRPKLALLLPPLLFSQTPALLLPPPPQPPPLFPQALFLLQARSFPLCPRRNVLPLGRPHRRPHRWQCPLDLSCSTSCSYRTSPGHAFPPVCV